MSNDIHRENELCKLVLEYIRVYEDEPIPSKEKLIEDITQKICCLSEKSSKEELEHAYEYIKGLYKHPQATSNVLMIIFPSAQKRELDLAIKIGCCAYRRFRGSEDDREKNASHIWSLAEIAKEKGNRIGEVCVAFELSRMMVNLSSPTRQMAWDTYWTLHEQMREEGGNAYDQLLLKASPYLLPTLSVMQRLVDIENRSSSHFLGINKFKVFKFFRCCKLKVEQFLSQFTF